MSAAAGYSLAFFKVVALGLAVIAVVGGLIWLWLRYYNQRL
ncbi:MAG: hypothetical protein V3R66_04200 [Rhodospirillales bacterium]